MKKQMIFVALIAVSLLSCACHAVAGPLSSKQSKKEFSRDDDDDFALVEARRDKENGGNRKGRPFTEVPESADGSRTKSI
jgi:hypothetical protein